MWKATSRHWMANSIEKMINICKDWNSKNEETFWKTVTKWLSVIWKWNCKTVFKDILLKNTSYREVGDESWFVIIIDLEMIKVGYCVQF